MALSTTSINGQIVRFGAGLRYDICTELSALGSNKALILSTPQQVNMAMELATTVGDRAAGRGGGGGLGQGPRQPSQASTSRSLTVIRSRRPLGPRRSAR